MTAAQAAGWAGTVLVLVAYGLATWQHRPKWFHAANVVGAFGIGWSAASVGAWPNLAMTVAFGLIGVWGLTRLDFVVAREVDHEEGIDRLVEAVLGPEEAPAGDVMWSSSTRSTLTVQLPVWVVSACARDDIGATAVDREIAEACRAAMGGEP